MKSVTLPSRALVQPTLARALEADAAYRFASDRFPMFEKLQSRNPTFDVRYLFDNNRTPDGDTTPVFDVCYPLRRFIQTSNGIPDTSYYSGPVSPILTFTRVSQRIAI